MSKNDKLINRLKQLEKEIEGLEIEKQRSRAERMKIQQPEKKDDEDGCLFLTIAVMVVLGIIGACTK